VAQPVTTRSIRLRCGDRALDLTTPCVMGVLNMTPDSFSDGGRHATLRDAIAHGEAMAAAGAAIIDVGGESTRPGAQAVPVDEEIRRVVPVIAALASLPVVVSVDTSHPQTMLAAIDAGARLVNDVRALRRPGALEAAATAGVAVCLMHMQGEPGSMQAAPRYDDVVGEVAAFLGARALACLEAGVARDALLVDPGFGFGKTLQHNLDLLRGLPQITAAGFPVLAGLSRKSMLGGLTGRPVEGRLAGSLALAVLALSRGASVLRVHDVAETVDAVKVWAAVAAGERS
jgi:dihydropteroate synthase